MLKPLPPDFVKRIRGAFPQEGPAWLRGLPDRLDIIADDLGLTPGAPCDLSYNYVCQATLEDGSLAILKCSVSKQDFERELHTLRTMAGEGVVCVLAEHHGLNTMVLERITPGDTLSGVSEGDDEVASEAMAGALSRARERARDSAPAIASLASRFDSVERWAKGFQRCRPLAKGRIAADVLDRAESIYNELLAEDEERILLHGDLHHDNVLLDEERGWTIIDPKGVMGPPAYETGAMLRNPPGVHARAGLEATMRRRIAILHEVLGDDPEVIAAWAFSQLVLSTLWMLEDAQDGWETDLELALCFQRLGGF